MNKTSPEYMLGHQDGYADGWKAALVWFKKRFGRRFL